MKLIKILLASLFIFVASILSEVLGQLISLIIPESYNLLRIIIAAITSILAFLLMYLLIAKKIIKNDFDWINFKSRLKFVYLGPISLILALIYLAYMFVGIHYYPTNVSLNMMMTTIFMTVFFAGLMAPLIEEITYRGVILQLFSDQYGMLVGTIVQSVFFTLAHFINGGINGFFSIILFLISGIVFGSFNGLLDYRARSIWPGFVVHSIFNMFTTFFTISNYNLGGWFFFYKLHSTNVLLTGGSTGMQSSLISILSFGVVGMLILFWDFNQNK